MIITETGFSGEVKVYAEDVSYNEMSVTPINFDISYVELDSITDITTIMTEMNKISGKIFFYGAHCDAQTRVVQLIEDEFERWKAETMKSNDIDDRSYKSEKSKERQLIIMFTPMYTAYTNRIYDEKYKLSLLKRAVSALESYGFKLHALKDYCMAIEKNS